MAERCVLLTNAPVATFQGLDCYVLITGGDVWSKHTLDGSTVVSRGSVTYRFDGVDRESSCVVAGGAVSDTNAAEFTAKKQPPPEPDPKWVFQNDKKFLGVKFYSVAEDGLEATADKDVVTVSKLDEKKLFAKAGVKTGDVIESINGTKVPSLHELDRLLCRATVSSGVAKLTVKRGEDERIIKVKLYDW